MSLLLFDVSFSDITEQARRRQHRGLGMMSSLFLSPGCCLQKHVQSKQTGGSVTHLSARGAGWRVERRDGGGGGAWSSVPVGEAGGGLGRDRGGRSHGGRDGGGGGLRGWSFGGARRGGQDGAGVGPQSGRGFGRSRDQDVRGQSPAHRLRCVVGGDGGSRGEGGRGGGGGGCQRGARGVQEHGVGDETWGGGGRRRGGGGAIGGLFRLALTEDLLVHHSTLRQTL